MHLFRIGFTLFLAAGALQTHADNYYEVLGVQPQSSFKKIKSSYEKQVKKLESYRSSQNNIQIIKIKEAYNVLSNPESRKLFDESLGLPEHLTFREKMKLASSIITIIPIEVKKSHKALYPEGLKGELKKQMTETMFPDWYKNETNESTNKVFRVALTYLNSGAIYGGVAASVLGYFKDDSDLLLSGLTALAVGTGSHLCAKAFLSPKQKEKSK